MHQLKDIHLLEVENVAVLGVAIHEQAFTDNESKIYIKQWYSSSIYQLQEYTYIKCSMHM